MCFGGSSVSAPTPAAAPAPPEKPPVAGDIGHRRATETQDTYGASVPNLRVDRSVGGTGGGSGLRM